jgi:hypothetical protein
MDDFRARGPIRSTGSKLGTVIVSSIVAATALGWGVISVVDAVDTADGCGSYGYGGGYGGYGCDDFSITVEPSTGLVDLQTVAVSGTGFLPNTYFGAAQCDAATLPNAGITACDLSTSRTTYTDGGGNVHVDMRVRRIIVVNGGEVDCALAPCVIGAATLDGTTPIEGTSFPIAFDPSVPAVPRLSVDLTVDDVSASSLSGTVTCNRDAEVFTDSFVEQQKGGHTSYAYGFTDQPVACSTTPTQWTTPLTGGSGALAGGPATYDVSASAYDGVEEAYASVSGEVVLSGAGVRSVTPSEQPGETVSVEILGATSGPDGITVDLRVTCDRPVPIAFGYVQVSQRVGLDEVSGYGQADFGPCDGAELVSLPLTYLQGTLAGGPAVVRATVYVSDVVSPQEQFFDSASAVAGVRLRGALRPAPVAIEPSPGSRITITEVTRFALTGTVVCEDPAEVELWAEIQQTRGRTTSYGYGLGTLPCDGLTDFTIPLDGDLTAGTAVASVYGTAYREIVSDPPGYELLWDDQQAASLRIRG